MADIENCKTVDNLIQFALDNPTEFIEIVVADGGSISTGILALLKNGILDERCRHERGHSIWEAIFADLDRRYPGKSKIERWERDRWPFCFERMPDSGLWVPFDAHCRPLVDHDRTRCFPAKQKGVFSNFR